MLKTKNKIPYIAVWLMRKLLQMDVRGLMSTWWGSNDAILRWNQSKFYWESVMFSLTLLVDYFVPRSKRLFLTTVISLLLPEMSFALPPPIKALRLCLDPNSSVIIHLLCNLQFSTTHCCQRLSHLYWSDLPIDSECLSVPINTITNELGSLNNKYLLFTVRKQNSRPKCPQIWWLVKSPF